MRPFAVLLLFALVATPSLAQNTPRQVTAEDYARAERQLQQHTSPLVFGGAVSPNWMDDGRFWYENQTSEGSEFVLVEPAEARFRSSAHGGRAQHRRGPDDLSGLDPGLGHDVRRRCHRARCRSRRRCSITLHLRSVVVRMQSHGCPSRPRSVAHRGVRAQR